MCHLDTMSVKNLAYRPIGLIFYAYRISATCVSTPERDMSYY
jgi:hypothetical protein